MGSPIININAEKIAGNFTGTTFSNGRQTLGSERVNFTGATVLETLSATTISAINAGTGGIRLRGYTSDSTHSTIYMRQATPSGTNYALYSDGSITNLNSPTTLNLAIGGNVIVAINSTLTSISNGTRINGYSYNLVTSGQSNSAQTINWSLTNNFDYTITANTTFTFSNTKNGETIVVAVSNNSATSGLTATFTAGTTSLKWQSAITPTQTSTTGKTDIYTFIQSNGIIYGCYTQNY